MAEGEEKKYKVGIVSMKYNKTLRLFETTFINGEKGPDISVDAVIAKDATITAFKANKKKATDELAAFDEKLKTVETKVNATVEKYNSEMTEIIKIVDDIERLVTK